MMACTSPPHTPPHPCRSHSAPPLPELTPSPAATAATPLPRLHTSPSLAPALAASPATTTTLTPIAKRFVPASRSIAQRCSPSSPTSEDSGSASPASPRATSYRDALLTVATQESALVAPPQLEVAP
jgi:hypothetical protein